MSTGGPDLFVICKNCQSEVSPYITECPYCGSRLRKRAPKLDRDGRVSERKRRTPTPSLPRLRRGEIPGIRGESRPYATIALVLAGFAGTLLWRAALVGSTHAIELWARYGNHLWWRLLVAPFTYTNTGYAIVVLGTIAVYGWLLERRHGPLLVLVLFALAGVGGAAVDRDQLDAAIGARRQRGRAGLHRGLGAPRRALAPRRTRDRRRPARHGGGGRGRRADAGGCAGGELDPRGRGRARRTADRAAARAHPRHLNSIHTP